MPFGPAMLSLDNVVAVPLRPVPAMLDGNLLWFHVHVVRGHPVVGRCGLDVDPHLSVLLWLHPVALSVVAIVMRAVRHHGRHKRGQHDAQEGKEQFPHLGSPVLVRYF